MRNKYGKLFIEIEDDGNGGYQVKDEYVKPLLDYVKSKQYKDIIILYGDIYYNVVYQYFGNSTITLSGSITIHDENGDLLTSESVSITYNMVTDVINVSVLSY